jgi:hypothetical protein
MDVNVTAREQILPMIRGVQSLVPEGRDDSSPALCAGCESVNVGTVPVGTIERFCSPRRSGINSPAFVRTLRD